MPETIYRGRRAVQIENDHLRVTVTCEGGHIAEIFDKQTKVNPLWTPPWPSIEPSAFDPSNGSYGEGAEAKLLAGILGHNVCLDLFGGPSPTEAAAGMTVHGESSVAPYLVQEEGGQLRQSALLPTAGLKFNRTLTLHDRAVRIREEVENLSRCDRPIAWTQHVTLGPPFLERGITTFRAPATHSRVYENDFSVGDYLKKGADFEWPLAPRSTEGTVDLQVFTDAPVSGAFTTHLMDMSKSDAWFLAFNPNLKLAFGYIWRQSDFPWMGIWEENHSRAAAPWCGKTLARGMEFGVSPIPESRREMITRGSLFGVPAYGWLPALGRMEAEYWAVASSADEIPESLVRPL